MIKTSLLSFFLLLGQLCFAQINEADQALIEKIKAAAEYEGVENKFDAQVWLSFISARMERIMPDEDKRIEFLTMVYQESKRAGVRPELVMSVIHVESYFKRFALSHVGAQGYMQVMPFWKDEIGHPEDNLFDPRTNLRYGTTILAHYLEIEKGGMNRALGRYNGSLGRMKYPNKVYDRWKKHWKIDDMTPY